MILSPLCRLAVYLAWLRLWERRAGLYETQFGLVLLVLASIVIVTTLIWWYATSIDREEALSNHTLPDFDRSREVLIDQTSMGDLKGTYDQPASADSSVKIAAYHDDRVLIEVDTSRAGVLVLHDIWYPGWQVTVDGTPAKVLRANVLFRGVEVPAGHHVVSFEFHPLSLANLGTAAGTLLHGSGED